MKWRCLCGRDFYKSRMCLKCGDRLPLWVAEGKLTFEERNAMTDQEYRTWVKIQEKLDERLISDAVSDLQKLITEMRMVRQGS